MHLYFVHNMMQDCILCLMSDDLSLCFGAWSPVPTFFFNRSAVTERFSALRFRGRGTPPSTPYNSSVATHFFLSFFFNQLINQSITINVKYSLLGTLNTINKHQTICGYIFQSICSTFPRPIEYAYIASLIVSISRVIKCHTLMQRFVIHLPMLLPVLSTCSLLLSPHCFNISCLRYSSP